MPSVSDTVELRYLSTSICILAERAHRASNAKDAKDFAEAACSLSYIRDSMLRLKSKNTED